MNRDEGQYFLTLICDELLEKFLGKKSIGNSKPTTTTSTSAGVAVSLCFSLFLSLVVNI